MEKFSRCGIVDKWNATLRGVKFNERFPILSMGLIIGGLFLAFFAQAASGQLSAPPPVVSAAPLNPEFIAWQWKVAMFAFETRDEEGHALGHIPSPFDRSHLRSSKVTSLLVEGAPASYDLRSQGYVTSVRNQLNCGSCWSFATYGSLESWLLKNEGETWDFSENHLKNYSGFDLAPCEGGNADMSTAYLARWSGPVDEANDPYHDWDDRPSPGGACQKYINSVLWFFTPSDIKGAVMSYGAVYVSMRWDTAYYNLSEYTYYYSGSSSANHGVTLVGWDDNKVVSGAPGNGAWLIKNSWGSDWGDNGYFWISYYDTRGVQKAVAFCDAVPTLTCISNYQYDPFGKTHGVGYGTTTAWCANIFTASADEYLGAVGFHALAKNTSYEIDIYDNFIEGSFLDLLGSVSGTVMYPGYHTVRLPSAISLTNSDDFAIVVKLTTPNYNFPIPIEKPIIGYSSGATANAGESYISSTGVSFTDITNYSGYENVNMCIKGLTVLADIGLRLYDGTEIMSIACEPEGILTSPLRIAKDGVIYGVVLVAPSDPKASKVMIETSSGIKAIRKL